MGTLKNAGQQIIGLFVGAAIGTTLGVLFAPNKGSKTRGRILTRVRYIAKNVSEKLNKGVDCIAVEADKIDDVIEEKIDEITISKKKK